MVPSGIFSATLQGVVFAFFPYLVCRSVIYFYDLNAWDTQKLHYFFFRLHVYIVTFSSNMGTCFSLEFGSRGLVHSSDGFARYHIPVQTHHKKKWQISNGTHGLNIRIMGDDWVQNMKCSILFWMALSEQWGSKSPSEPCMVSFPHPLRASQF